MNDRSILIVNILLDITKKIAINRISLRSSVQHRRD